MSHDQSQLTPTAVHACVSAVAIAALPAYRVLGGLQGRGASGGEPGVGRQQLRERAVEDFLHLLAIAGAHPLNAQTGGAVGAAFDRQIEGVAARCSS